MYKPLLTRYDVNAIVHQGLMTKGPHKTVTFLIVYADLRYQ